ncbi:MurR/RpiR family transcriptional regulator [Ligilactobacillus saerimneri]|uniref:RpiR family glv operon transcriptional regulator n=3 Tax=Ligilactobacillus saerimneri TaxID=228229 RepID=M5J6L8_9LACO|nr:MurR/RpiR family transcriptional regulator [Ligilactobacillus saerimneri]EKW99490.1 RpiR family glv operon transcriptional regulator [Ligilactobacillus saerimneri 30a]KRL72855.1 transcriptional regulator [Ligilactobacillus saerimneri DSM 16049]MDI9206253.1 MurR/RpiR family transcriptional regulator [Ligilactobacillus saerimneri]QLL78490.1 SIS domain-containing protein [Ligilactobacillus saerimneri]
MNFDQHVKLVYDVLSASEKETINYIRQHRQQVTTMSINELAAKVLSSRSTILRLAKKLGFRGYTDLKYTLREDLNQPSIVPSDLLGNLQMDINKTFQYAQQTNFEPLINAIKKAQTLVIYTTGFTQENYARELSKELMLVGKDNVIISGQSNFEMVSTRLTSADLVVVVSLSGSVANVRDTITELVLNGVPICSVTDFGKNFLEEHAKYKLFYKTSGLPSSYTQAERSMVGLNIILTILARKYREAILFDE